MIGAYCRKFRMNNNLTLLEVINLTDSKDLKVGTLSSFEMGNSSNIKHLETYIKLSNKLHQQYLFMNNLTLEVLEHGKGK